MERRFKGAERVGFEPTVGINLHSISNRAPSTGLSHLSFFAIVPGTIGSCTLYNAGLYRVPSLSGGQITLLWEACNGND